MFPWRRKRHALLSDETMDSDGLTAVPIALSAVLRPLATALAFASDGRYRIAAPGEPADIVVVEPRSGPEIRELRQRCAHSAIVVWDRAQATSPAFIVDDLGAGADAYVADPNVTVLLSHVDALRRRVLTRGSCAPTPG